jgi:hypothetical protein
MNQPSPWILLIGGGSLLNVSLMIGGAAAPAWVRYGGMAACIALGLTCIGLALHRYFGKKPERVKPPPRRSARVELLPEVAARRAGNANAGAPGDVPAKRDREQGRG